MLTTQWDSADKAFGKGQEAYIEFGQACAKLNASGITQEAIGARYDMELSSVKQLCIVGADQRIVSNTNFLLPKSTYSLYLLTTLDDAGFAELAKPTTKQADILAYKQRIAAPKPPVQPTRPPCPGVEGSGLGEWTWWDDHWSQKVSPAWAREQAGLPPEVPVQRTRSVLMFLEDYISSTSNENRVEILKTIRRLEHPDRGGSSAVTAEINLILGKEK